MNGKSARILAALLGFLAAVTLGVFATRAQEPPARLSGQVLDAAKAPVAGVRVGLRGAKAFVVTDGEGRFDLDLNPLAAAKKPSRPAAHIEFDKDGYLGQSLAVESLEALARPIVETLPPVVATPTRAEFTDRVSMRDVLPAIADSADGAPVSAARWRAYFSAMGQRPDAGLTQQVLFQAYAPKSAARLKAVFLMTRHGIGSIDQPQLVAFADRNAAALVAVSGDPMQRGFYPPEALDPYLARLGRMLSRPELASLPMITFGHSNGTGFSALIAALRPERTIAWISYHPGSTFYLQFPDIEKTPGLVMHGLIDPFFSPAHVKTIEMLRRERKAPLTFTLEPVTPHFPVDKGQSATFSFIAAYCEAVLRLRLKPDGGLRPVKLSEGWLGAPYDRAKGGPQLLEIAPYDAFPGDASEAVWLPDAQFAEVWRRYENTDPRSE